MISRLILTLKDFKPTKYMHNHGSLFTFGITFFCKFALYQSVSENNISFLQEKEKKKKKNTEVAFNNKESPVFFFYFILWGWRKIDDPLELKVSLSRLVV